MSAINIGTLFHSITSGHDDRRAECVALCGEAKRLYDQEKYALSLQACQLAQAINDQLNPPAENKDYLLRRIARLYREHLGQPDKAVAAAKEAYEIDPNNSWNAEEYGMALYASKQYRQAAEHLIQVTDRAPACVSPLIFFSLIECLEICKEYKAALEYLDMVRDNYKLLPLSLDAARMKIFQHMPDKHEETLILADKIAAYPQSLYNQYTTKLLSDFYYGHGLFKKALPYLIEHLESSPEDEDALNAFMSCCNKLDILTVGKEIYKKQTLTGDDRYIILAAGHYALRKNKPGIAHQCADRLSIDYKGWRCLRRLDTRIINAERESRNSGPEYLPR